MIDPATPKALRVIAAAMREPLYQTDMHGIEALVLDNAANEIEMMRRENDSLYARIVELEGK